MFMFWRRGKASLLQKALAVLTGILATRHCWWFELH